MKRRAYGERNGPPNQLAILETRRSIVDRLLRSRDDHLRRRVDIGNRARVRVSAASCRLSAFGP